MIVKDAKIWSSMTPEEAETVAAVLNELGARERRA